MPVKRVSPQESNAGSERAHLQDVLFSASRCYALPLDAPSIGLVEDLEGRPVDVMGYITPPDDLQDESLRTIAISADRRTRTYRLLAMKDGRVYDQDAIPADYASPRHEHRFEGIRGGYVTAVLAPDKRGMATRLGIGMAKPAKRRGAELESALTVSAGARVDTLGLVLHRDLNPIKLLNEVVIGNGDVVMAQRRCRLGFSVRIGIVATISGVRFRWFD